MAEDAVSFDPVNVGHGEMEKANQSSSLGHGSQDVKTAPYNHYYTPNTAQLYFPPARYGSRPVGQQRHLSYMSALSSAEDANYSRPISVGGPVPEDIRRQYRTK